MGLIAKLVRCGGTGEATKPAAGLRTAAGLQPGGMALKPLNKADGFELDGGGAVEDA